MQAWLERRWLSLLVVALVAMAFAIAYPRFTQADHPEFVFHEEPFVPDGVPIVVEVRGAVDAPGVYELRGGDRVIDALQAAGGVLDSADLQTVNLARRLRDEDQVAVPDRRGPGPALGFFGGDGPDGGRIDINRASQAQLDSLPGIGEAYARRIVDSRRVDGPFRTTQELVERRVLPRALYERISPMLIVEGP